MKDYFLTLIEKRKYYFCAQEKRSSDKKNYRPVSILSLVSKVYERAIFNQLSEYMKNLLNKILCGSRKAHSTQHALFKLLPVWQSEFDNSGNVATILMDLSKAYDCIPHDLLIAKFKAFSLDKISLNRTKYSRVDQVKFVEDDYLNNRQQRTKIGSSFSFWHDIITGIPQGSVLEPLLFNIFINDLFLLQIKSKICNFADDNTLYSYYKELWTIISNLEYEMTSILSWFRYNSLKVNPGKFQFIILGSSDGKCFILKINAIGIRNTNEAELLGLTIDHKLKCDAHIDKLCITARFKIHALRKIRGKVISKFIRK